VTAELHAARAVRAYTAMRREFLRRDGLYRRDGRLRLPRAAAHLWPAARAFAGAVDLLGVSPRRLAGLDAAAAVDAHLVMLERYWDARSPLPAYASDVVGSRFGGDRYYDDNAWVGLVLAQLERLRPGGGHLARAGQLFAFAAAGWDTRPDAPSPGGVFWVEQGTGTGLRNHDRNTVSNAPNAQLALHLDELSPPPDGGGGRSARARDMYAWVNATLDAGRDAGEPGTGLFWDKLRGDGTIDRAQWTYNQGSMIGANVLLARRPGAEDSARYLKRAEAIATKALEHYAGGLQRQPPAFNAILFRNLLQLHAAIADTGLRERIRATMESYAESAWSTYRDRRDRFRFSGGGVTLLDQSAMVQIYALLAWEPEDYARLA
jgi:hypothetical protein